MRRRVVIPALALSLAMQVVPAYSATQDGCLLTSFVSMTFQTTPQVGSPSSMLITYAVSAKVLVATPSIHLRKVGTPTLQVPGGVITFCITFLNASYYTSAFNVAIHDRTPDNMNYVGASMTSWPPAVTVNPWYALPGSPDTWTSGEPAGVTLYYLRWMVDVLNPRESAMIFFNMSVL